MRYKLRLLQSVHYLDSEQTSAKLLQNFRRELLLLALRIKDLYFRFGTLLSSQALRVSLLDGLFQADLICHHLAPSSADYQKLVFLPKHTALMGQLSSRAESSAEVTDLSLIHI